MGSTVCLPSSIKEKRSVALNSFDMYRYDASSNSDKINAYDGINVDEDIPYASSDSEGDSTLELESSISDNTINFIEENSDDNNIEVEHDHGHDKRIQSSTLTRLSQLIKYFTNPSIENKIINDIVDKES